MVIVSSIVYVSGTLTLKWEREKEPEPWAPE